MNWSMYFTIIVQVLIAAVVIFILLAIGSAIYSELRKR